MSVNKATDGRQTPWDSSSLTDDFRFFPARRAAQRPKPPAAKRTVDEWRRELQGKPVEVANEMIVADGTDEAYEAFVALFAQPPFGPQAREWLDRHRRMVAWNNAVIINTAAGLSRLPRAISRQRPHRDRAQAGRAAAQPPEIRRPAVAAPVAPATNVALAAPTCPCGAPPPVPLQKVDLAAEEGVDLPPKKRVEPEPPKARQVATAAPPLA